MRAQAISKRMKEKLTRRDFIKTTGYVGAAAVALPGLSLQAEDEKKVCVAFVGCAHIHTPGFINLLKTRKDVVVKLVWDHDAARAERRAKELNAKAVADANEIWSDAQVDAVVICSETNRHLELVLAAAKAKKHMFVEKPLGFTAKDSKTMAQAIDEAKVAFTTGYFMRTEPINLFLKEQVEKGSFGKITRIRGSNCHSGSLGGWFDTEWRWMADPKIAGVGAFGDLGTHSLDIMMWLMGDVESAIANIKVVNGRYGECDESGEGLIQFKNGVTGTLAGGWVDVANPVSMIISGTEGHAVVMDGKLYFQSSKVQGADGKQPWEKLPKSLPLPLHQFIDVVGQKGDRPLVTPKEAADRVSVMEAMYRGAAERKFIQPA